MARHFVPPNFDAPEHVDAGKFYLRILAPELLALDYEAYMSSVEHLQGAFGPGDTWPAGTTIDLALIDVAWCKQEFISRRSFNYAVLSPDESYEIGSFYVSPCPKVGFDAQLSAWVRKSEYDKGMDATLFAWGKQWVHDVWPFRNVACPGREIPWDEWAGMEDKPI